MSSRNKHLENAKEVFQAEFEISAHADAVATNDALSKAELLNEYKTLAKEYKILLRQAVKITSIGDSTQEKLVTNQEKLKELNLKVRSAYKELSEKATQLADAYKMLKEAQQKSDVLLLNILPEAIANRLKKGETLIADNFKEVTVLFADIVGFTAMSSKIPPEELIALLQEVFTLFDDLCDELALEKIKTIGDSYMVVGGLPEARPDHAEAVAEMALGMIEGLKTLKAAQQHSLAIRIGIHSGEVIAGVIGKKKFVYDLWGDTVNTAARMESQGLTGQIHVSSATFELLKEKYVFGTRGAVTIKGKGDMQTYFLTGRKVEQRIMIV